MTSGNTTACLPIVYNRIFQKRLRAFFNVTYRNTIYYHHRVWVVVAEFPQFVLQSAWEGGEGRTLYIIVTYLHIYMEAGMTLPVGHLEILYTTCRPFGVGEGVIFAILLFARIRLRTWFERYLDSIPFSSNHPGAGCKRAWPRWFCCSVYIICI